MITLRQVAQAIRQNGLKQATNGAYINVDGIVSIDREDAGSGFYVRDRNEIVSACAMGQAGVNLHVDPQALHSALDARFHSLGYDIMSMNDDEETALEEIADYIEEIYSDHLDEAVID